MLQVDRKKRKERSPRRWLWVLLGALLLAACAYAAVRLHADEIIAEIPEEAPDLRGTLENRKTEEISRITIHVRGQEPWTAIRGGDGKLRLENETEWALDETRSARMEDALANIVYEAVLTRNAADYRDTPEDFGLDDPELTATVTYTDGKSVTLRIGASSGLADADYHYMTMEGDDRLFAVATSFLEDLRVERELLRPVEQPEIQTSRLARVTVLDGKGEKKAEWTLQGDVTDADAAENWMMTAPVTYPADYDAMVNLKKNVSNLRLGILVGEADPDTLEACGLAEPSAEIRLEFAAASTGQVSGGGVYNVTEREAGEIVFRIGSARNELTDYVRWEDRVYTMNHFSLTPFLESKPADFAAKYLVMLPLDSVAKMTAERGGETVCYELTRVSGQDPETNEQTTEISVTRNGASMAYSVFEAAYNRWMVATVSGRLPENWEKRETREKYTFESLSGKTHTVELSEFDAMHDAVTLDGCTMFYLIRGGLGELP